MKTNVPCAGRRAARASLAAAMLATCTVAGCRTTTAAAAARPPAAANAGEGVAAARTAELKPIVPPVPVAASGDRPSLDVPPRLLVMPSGSAYVVLRAGPEQGDGALSWDVLYLAGFDAGALAQPNAGEWLSAVARELVAAFGPLAELAGVDRLTVTAMFGKPGAGASFQRLPFERDASGWRPGRAEERGASQLPRLTLQFVRDRSEEASARRVAAAFITDAHRADYDAAWEKTSARVKAMMSRTEFVRHLSEFARSAEVTDQDVYVTFGAPLERFLPGSNMEAWVARETATGLAVQALELRLDDDMEWRVSAVVELIPSAGAPALTANSQALEPGRAR